MDDRQRQVPLKTSNKEAATTDHYLPIQLGGTDDFTNWRLACVVCNQAKSDLHPDHYMALLREKGRIRLT